jgi:glutamine synthetase type III
MTSHIKLDEIFGKNVFSKKTLQEYVTKEVYEKFVKAISEDTKEILDIDLANEIANAMKE